MNREWHLWFHQRVKPESLYSNNYLVSLHCYFASDSYVVAYFDRFIAANQVIGIDPPIAGRQIPV